MMRTTARMIERAPLNKMVGYPAWDPLHYMQSASAGTQIALSHIVVGYPEGTTYIRKNHHAPPGWSATSDKRIRYIRYPYTDILHL